MQLAEVGKAAEAVAAVERRLTNLEIAAELHVSVRTVETHRANLMSKLKLASQADLIRFAIQHGLVPPTLN